MRKDVVVLCMVFAVGLMLGVFLTAGAMGIHTWTMAEQARMERARLQHDIEERDRLLDVTRRSLDSTKEAMSGLKEELAQSKVKRAEEVADLLQQLAKCKQKMLEDGQP